MDADDLYGLPLEQFTAERNRLAKELKAPEIKTLRKPSVAAWSVNQLIRTEPKAVAALFKAGDALRKAQEKVLAGRGDAGDLRAAVDGEREAVSALLDKASDLTPAVREQVSETLHAAALDDAARAQVRDGTLVRELRHAGLGMSGGFEAVPSERRVPPRKAAAREVRGPAPPPEPRRRVAAREQARKAARIAEGDARRRLDLAGRALRAAEERRDRAQEALDQAKADVKAAQAESKAASAAHRKAAAELEQP